MLAERRQAEEGLAEAAGRHEQATAALYRLRSAVERLELRRERAEETAAALRADADRPRLPTPPKPPSYERALTAAGAWEPERVELAEAVARLERAHAERRDALVALSGGESWFAARRPRRRRPTPEPAAARGRSAPARGAGRAGGDVARRPRRERGGAAGAAAPGPRRRGRQPCRRAGRGAAAPGRPGGRAAPGGGGGGRAAVGGRDRAGAARGRARRDRCAALPEDAEGEALTEEEADELRDPAGAPRAPPRGARPGQPAGGRGARAREGAASRS